MEERNGCRRKGNQHIFASMANYTCRGVSVAFGCVAVQRFLEKYKLELICRAHQVVEDGYELIFDRQLVTLFSAPNYCGEFDNAAGMMIVNSDLVLSFKILRPSGHKAKFPELFPDYVPSAASSDSLTDRLSGGIKDFATFEDHIPTAKELEATSKYIEQEQSTETDESSVLYG